MVNVILEANLTEKYTHLEGSCNVCHQFKPVRAVGLKFSCGELVILICKGCSGTIFKRSKKGEFSIK